MKRGYDFDSFRKAKKLHDSIMGHNIEGVRENIKEWYFDMYGFNGNNESAIAASLRLKKFDIHKILLKNRFQLGPKENLGFIMLHFLAEDKEKMRSNHFECFKVLAENYLLILITKCKLIHTSSEKVRKNFFIWIDEVFKKLAAIDWIMLVLQIVAFSDDLELIFDFDSYSVDYIDPTFDKGTKGVCYLYSAKILIGAKGLLSEDPSKSRYAMAVLVHEITHFAMQILYENEAKPYRKGDKINEERFQKVLEECKASKTMERIVELVFDYHKKDQHSELIVRVTQILAFYSSDKEQEKLHEVKKILASLFAFFEEKVVTDLMEEIPKFPDKLRIREANEVCGLFKSLENSEFSLRLEGFDVSKLVETEEEINILTSNCVRLTMKLIFDEVKLQDKLDGKIFMTFEAFKNEKNLKICSKVSKNAVVIVDCDGKTMEDVREAAGNFDTEAHIVVIVPENIGVNVPNDSKFSHLWSHLTEESQNKLLKTKVDFQGVKIESFEALNVAGIELIDLNDLLDKKEIIIGSEIKFDEVKIHIKRKFIKPEARQIKETKKIDPEPLGFTETFLVDSSQKVYLLIAEPGYGKSTEFKIIAQELKKEFPENWITYIDLKKYTEVIQMDGKVSRKFQNAEEIAKYFAKEILKLIHFEEKIFEELFMRNRVTFLFDGVDEISPSFKEFVMMLMVSIKEKSQNQLWIAARPHLAEELEAKLATKAFKFLMLSKENRQEYFGNFFYFLNYRMKEQIVQKIESRCHDFFFLSPMLLNMIANLFTQDQDFKPSGANLYSIYNNFVANFIAINVYKDHDAVEVNIKLNHTKRAFEVVLGHKIDIAKDLNTIFGEIPPLPVDQLVRLGFICENRTGKSYFVHQTFAEYFVADFFVENIFENSCEKEIVAELCYQCMKSNKTVIKFMNDKLEDFPFGDNFKPSQSFLIMFGMFRSQFETIKHFIRYSCINLVKYWSMSLIGNREELLNSWVEQESGSVLMIAAQFQSLDFIQNLWSFVKNNFKREEIIKILTGVEWNDRNILHFALENDDEKFFEFFFEKGREYLNETEYYERFFSPVHPLWATNNLKKVLEICKKNFHAEKFRGVLLSSYEPGRTLLQRICFTNDEQTFDFVIDLIESLEKKEIIEMMCKMDNRRNFFLMMAAKSANKQKLEKIWKFTERYFNVTQQKKILLQEECTTCRVLECSSRNNDAESFHFIVEVYEKTFGAGTVKKLLSDRFESGVNILEDIVKDWTMSGSSFVPIWNFTENLFGTQNLKEMLVKKCKSEGCLVFEGIVNEKNYLPVIELFITKNCTNDVSYEAFQFWLFVARFSSLEFINKLVSVVDENPEFAKEFFSKLFYFKNAANKNIIDFSNLNGDSEVSRLFNMKFEEILKLVI